MKIKLISIFLIILALLAAAAYGILNYPYSKGVRSGRLVKLSKKGIIYPTYEGTLDLGSGDELTWNFSIHDDNIGNELSKSSGKKVKLQYQEIFYKLFYDTKYNVTKFDVLSTLEASNDKRFCRLVNILRRNPSMVKVSRELIMKYDPSLLNLIRGCQK